MTLMPSSLEQWKSPTTRARHDASLELLRLTVINNKYIPVTPTAKQALFLVRPELEVLYGGAAMGGKSIALLMGALQYVDHPGYAALLLRRTYADLAKPEAVMDVAQEWLTPTDAVWSAERHTWTFPSGATVSFGYLDTEGSETQYQSAAYQYCAFDELTQFTEKQYRYLFSRLRRKQGVKIPLRMRAATNPGGRGHEWVKARFITGRSPGRLFVSAKLDDNPHADREQYHKSLAELDPVTRKQYEDGDWDVRQEGGVAKREWFPLATALPAQGRRVRYWDFAATEASNNSKRKGPDWTVGTLMQFDGGMWYVAHVVRERTSGVEKLVIQTAQADGKQVPVAFEQEPGASGKLFSASLVRQLAGFTVRAIPSTGDKLVRARPFLSQAEAGNVRILEAFWNATWLDEITHVPEGDFDDQFDSAAGAFAYLTSYGGGVY